MLQFSHVFLAQDRGLISDISSPLRLLIADSDRMFAEALSVALEAQEGFVVHDPVPDSPAGTLQRLTDFPTDIVIADYWLRGMHGSALTRLVRKRSPQTKVVLLTLLLGAQEISESLRAGAKALLPRTLTVNDFAEVLRRVHAEDSFIIPSQLRPLLNRLPPPEPSQDEAWDLLVQLSPREIEILRLLAFGPVDEVAKALSLSVRTVEHHVYRIMKKTETASQSEAISLARRFRVIE